ncbi:hypothetical protein A6R68_16634 [Neotoma lepida]|uniref:Homeobox domain-containing protein n=1 Tax=Neotoma lepida TaxID=56216 RepID=A0A1A6HG39_NEOLE|nr:hypothetical protein A6R68_16634 [Neotoma lepida]
MARSAVTQLRQLTCKRKEQEPNKDRNSSQKKSRLVFTDLQRRTLFAIFKENKRPSKEMQITISQQLGLELTTVSNFFMNARRRSLEKWQDDLSTGVPPKPFSVFSTNRDAKELHGPGDSGTDQHSTCKIANYPTS